MNKANIIEKLSGTMEISERDAKKVVNIFFDSITSALAGDQRAEIRGLCSFKVKQYDGYIGRNPKTGESAEVKPKKLPVFKCGKELKERVDRR